MMPPIDTPLNKAHQHAANAEDYMNQGLLVPAAEEHYKSAEAFLLCVEQAGDEGTRRTLRMLYNEHSKSGKELQRKITKLKEEGKDPNVPQVSRTPIPTGPIYASPSVLAPTVSSSNSHPRGRLSESNHTIDESYMVLGQQSDHTFNEFWKVFEGMLDNLSQPVAFATAPLAGPRSDRISHMQSRAIVNSSQDKTIPQETGSNAERTTLRNGSARKAESILPGLEQEGQLYMSSAASKAREMESQKATRTIVLPNMLEATDNFDLEEVLADPDSPSGESFFMIPSASAPSIAGLTKENKLLKCEVESLQRRLDLAERMRVEQEQQIREGISQARREAQRVMNSTYLPPRPLQSPVDLSVFNLKKVPTVSAFPPMGNGDQETQLMRRVKELEEEVRTVRTENEKQKAMIMKFRERWDKLKESAKRKRNAKANAGLESVREQCIDEEPEAEAEAEVEERPEVS